MTANPYAHHHVKMRRILGPYPEVCPSCGKRTRDMQLSLQDPEGPNVYVLQATSHSTVSPIAACHVPRILELRVSDDPKDYRYECRSCNGRKRVNGTSSR